MIVWCKIAVCMFIKNPFPCFDDLTLHCGGWWTGVFWFVALIKDIKCIFKNPFIPFTAEIVSSHHQLFMVAKVPKCVQRTCRWWKIQAFIFMFATFNLPIGECFRLYTCSMNGELPLKRLLLTPKAFPSRNMD